MRRVAILHSDIVDHSREDELDTLVEAQAVAETLTQMGVTVELQPFAQDLAGVIRSLGEFKPDFVFNLVESVNGGSELVPLAAALFEALKLRHTGSSASALALQQSKLITKRVLEGESLPTAPWCGLFDLGNGRFSPGQTYIIKSVWEHCSLGMDDASVLCLETREQARAVVEGRQLKFGGEFFIEHYIDGREFNLALIGGAAEPQLLPPAEMIFENYPKHKPRIVGYDAKWKEESFECSHTVRRYGFPQSDQVLLKRLGDLAMDCWRVMGLSGYARIDFRVDQNNNPWILEVNANPCIAPDAGFAAAACEAGMDYGTLIREVSRHLV